MTGGKDEEKCFHFTYFYTPKYVYLQSPENNRQYIALCNSLERLNHKELGTVTKISYDKIYGFHRNNKLYRVKGVNDDVNESLRPKKLIRIILADEGSYRTIGEKELKLLPTSLSQIPPLAELFIINGFEPGYLSNEKTKELIHMVKAFLSKNMITVKRLRKNFADIYVGNQHLNLQLIRNFSPSKYKFDFPVWKEGFGPHSNKHQEFDDGEEYVGENFTPRFQVREYFENPQINFNEIPYKPSMTGKRNLDYPSHAAIPAPVQLRNLSQNSVSGINVNSCGRGKIVNEKTGSYFGDAYKYDNSLPPVYHANSLYQSVSDERNEHAILMEMHDRKNGHNVGSSRMGGIDTNGLDNGDSISCGSGRYVDDDSEVQHLKGRIRAYEQELKTLREGNILTKNQLEQSCKYIRQLMISREELKDKFDTVSPLLKAIEYLHEDRSFHHTADCINERSSHLQDLVKSRRNIPYGGVKKLQEYLDYLNVEEKLEKVERMSADLDQLSIQKNRSSCNNAMEACGEYKAWRNMYEKVRESTDLTIYAASSYLHSCSYKIMLSARTSTNPLPSSPKVAIDPNTIMEKGEGSLCDILLHGDAAEISTREIITHAKDEGKVMKGVNFVFEKIFTPINREIKMRLRKLKQASLAKDLVQNVQVLKEDERYEDECTEHISLYKFSSGANYGKIQLHLKITVVQDVVSELCHLHGKNGHYLHINPENILMNHGATLRPENEIKVGEPVLPFRFAAPECEDLIKNRGPSTNISYTPTKGDESHFLKADIYSLGQLMVWLSCVGVTVGKDPEEIGFLNRMRSKVPFERPDIRMVLNELPNLLSELFDKAMPVVELTDSEGAEKFDSSLKPKEKMKSKKRINKSTIKSSENTDFKLSNKIVEQGNPVLQNITNSEIKLINEVVNSQAFSISGAPDEVASTSDAYVPGELNFTNKPPSSLGSGKINKKAALDDYVPGINVIPATPPKTIDSRGSSSISPNRNGMEMAESKESLTKKWINDGNLDEDMGNDEIDAGPSSAITDEFNKNLAELRLVKEEEMILKEFDDSDLEDSD